MKHGRLILDRAGNDFQLVDSEGGVSLQLTREDARFLFCWLMHRLNVKEATLSDGRKVEGFYHFDQVKESINAMSETSDAGITDPVEFIAEHLEPVPELPSGAKPDKPSKNNKGSAHR